MVGDFNSTRWNPPFGELLDSGLHDAHESVGQGLSRSWPNLGWPGVPLMRLDHALVNAEVGVVSVHDVDIPGSDHVGFVTELAVGGSRSVAPGRPRPPFHDTDSDEDDGHAGQIQDQGEPDPEDPAGGGRRLAETDQRQTPHPGEEPAATG